jgi:hypothetical protein
MNDDRPENAVRRQHHVLAIGLFFLSPLVGEFLLGNEPITSLPGLFLLAPMYGGGALLIREIARRTGRGWPTMVLLAAAYGLLEEGPIDQLLFNPAYLGLDSFVGLAKVPVLDVSASLIQATLTLHTVWSVCVPIAIMETFSDDPKRPWLGNVGLAVTGVAFVAGSVLLAAVQYQQFRFIASVIQFIGSAIIIAALIVLAFVGGRRPAPRSDAPAPAPGLVGAVAFGVSSVYWIESEFLPEDLVSEWLSVGWWFVLVGVIVALCVRWSRRCDWDATHRLALAGGALLTYVWAGFAHAQATNDVPSTVAVLGNMVFGLSAITLLAAAVGGLKRRRAEEPHHSEHVRVTNGACSRD